MNSILTFTTPQVKFKVPSNDGLQVVEIVDDREVELDEDARGKHQPAVFVQSKRFHEYILPGDS